jgi:hypothetical protein
MRTGSSYQAYGEKEVNAVAAFSNLSSRVET